MESIKKRGVKQVLLFASDGLAGMRDAVKRQFPEAEHQQCRVHLSRTVARYIRNKDLRTCRGKSVSFYKFPEASRKSIYTTNMIERSNKGLKHKSKAKEQFPNEDALDRFVCCYYSDLNRSYSERMQRGFCQASAEIL